MYYVTCTDKVLSGWGLAENKTSKIVCLCENYEDAEKVQQLWKSFDGRIYVNICDNKPYYNNVTHHTSWKYFDVNTQRVVNKKMLDSSQS